MSSLPTLLLTGATGFLGGALQQRLGEGVRVVPQGNRTCPPGGVQANLTDPGAVERLVDEVRPDVVLNAAAAREPDRCEVDIQGAEDLNREVPARFAAALPSTAQLIQVSTDYVFDGLNPPFTEADAVSPVNVYGRTKAEAETRVLAHASGAVLRVPVLVGEGPGFVQQMIDQIRNPEAQLLDDVLVRHPTWIVDVAEVCAWMIAQRVTGIWQASSEQGGTRYALTQRVAKALGQSMEHLSPSDEVIPRTAQRPANSKLSPQKLLAAGGPRCLEIEDVVKRLNL